MEETTYILFYHYADRHHPQIYSITYQQTSDDLQEILEAAAKFTRDNPYAPAYIMDVKTKTYVCKVFRGQAMDLE